MPSTLTYITTTLVLLTAIFAAYIYLVGLPPALKRDLERKALRTMGENKASYLFRTQLEKAPDGPPGVGGDVKKGLGNLGGGALKNPLGEAVGETGDEATSGVTGR
ncbi:hypothetical protein BST61_g2948 [Cercospora zeina]